MHLKTIEGSIGLFIHCVRQNYYSPTTPLLTSSTQSTYMKYFGLCSFTSDKRKGTYKMFSSIKKNYHSDKI